MSVTPDDNDPVGDDVYQPDAELEVPTDTNVLDPEDTLAPRGTDQALDEGYSPPEKPMGLDAKGTTVAEQAEGDTLDERLAEEVPDPTMAVPDPLAEDPGPVRADSDPATRVGDADDTREPLLDGRQGDLDTDGELLDDQVGDARTGRLRAPSGGVGPDVEATEVAQDVGIDGGAAGAEEAAVHTVEDDEAPGLTTP